MIEEEHFGKAKNELWIKCCISYDKHTGGYNKIKNAWSLSLILHSAAFCLVCTPPRTQLFRPESHLIRLLQIYSPRVSFPQSGLSARFNWSSSAAVCSKQPSVLCVSTMYSILHLPPAQSAIIIHLSTVS